MKNGTKNRVLLALARLAVVYYLKEFIGIFHTLKPTLFSGVEWNNDKNGYNNLLKFFDIPFNPVEETHFLTDDLYNHNHYRF